ncbi:MAG: RagB/SusD family nutrient uptake outer membrane protein [Runella sp.]
MKKTLLFSTLFTGLLTGCNEQFVNLIPPTQITTASYYKSASDIAGGVTAAYGALQPTYNFMFLFGDVTTDNTFTPQEAIGSGQGDYDLLPVLTNQPQVANMWNNSYAIIGRANIVLSRMPSITMNEQLKSRYEGEMKFLRALSYFNLVRLFGAVPLTIAEIQTVDELYTFGRESVDNVYAQIIKDLTDAERLLPATYAAASDRGRATNGAAKALLGKVFLTRKQYPQAAAKLKEVIDSGTYRLLPNYADVFAVSNVNNAEVVFSVQYTKGNIGEGSPFTNFFATHNTISGTSIVAVGEALGFSQITPDLEAAFEAGDTRKATSVGVVRNTNFYTRKYMDVPSGPLDAGNHWMVIRYADVLLMYAEALNEQAQTTQALAFLNQIRQRAGLSARTNLSQAEMRLVLEQERRVELSMEGHRWFDLIRTDRLLPVMNAYHEKYGIRRGGGVLRYEAFVSLFPIPIVEITKNPSKITQNPGY